jgi:hypothetical protein
VQHRTTTCIYELLVQPTGAQAVEQRRRHAPAGVLLVEEGVVAPDAGRARDDGEDVLAYRRSSQAVTGTACPSSLAKAQ